MENKPYLGGNCFQEHLHECPAEVEMTDKQCERVGLEGERQESVCVRAFAHNTPMSLYERVDALDGRQLQGCDTGPAAQISQLTFWASLPTHGPLGE